ncbi:hypothetical protein HYH02_004618 [Chlamydomonas schloesseri]|uniref:Centrosomal protein of 70 kDa n=1 Tax=Chlamydomonas schloesseri TaxID=2026947 RepID=A0A835WPU1_9CHLO|nr:hypothetical protein HYH02_004618 [Chlamydomonas schloesseri]|eukprot:KAG2450781.1 hypothetical protein HYH02_004618 [Chlamydomonas schloesseri]
MDASDAAPPGRSVFNSDDDLTSFLAGLRAKYASLYPQYLEGEQSTRGADAAGAVNAGAVDRLDDAADASSCAAAAAAIDTALAGTSLSFDHKLTQLRSSLQSLQQLLPPRASTTANLLDSFMAVSGDRLAQRLHEQHQEQQIQSLSAGPGADGAGTTTGAADAAGADEHGRGADAAFMELAVGYSRRTLQPPSSEGSGASVGSAPGRDPAGTCALLHHPPEPPPPQPAEPAPAHCLYLQPGSCGEPQSSNISSPEVSSDPEYRADANEPWHIGDGSYGAHGSALGHTDSELGGEVSGDHELHDLHQEPRRTSTDAEGSVAEVLGTSGTASAGGAVVGPQGAPEAAAVMGSITRSMVSPARRRVWQLAGQAGGALGGSGGGAPEPAQPLSMPEAERGAWPPLPASMRPAGSAGSAGLRLLHALHQGRSHGGASSGASTGGGGTGPDATRESSAAWESEATGAEDRAPGEDHGSTSDEEPGLAAQTEWCGFGGFGQQSPSLLYEQALTPGLGFGQLPTGGDSRAPGGLEEPELQCETQLEPSSLGFSSYELEGGAERQHHQQPPSSERHGSPVPGSAAGAAPTVGAARPRRRWGSPLHQGSAVSESWQPGHAVGIVGSASSSLFRGSPSRRGNHNALAATDSPTVATARVSAGGSPHRAFGITAMSDALAVAGAEGEVLVEPDAPPPPRPAASGAAAVHHEPYGGAGAAAHEAFLAQAVGGPDDAADLQKQQQQGEEEALQGRRVWERAAAASEREPSGAEWAAADGDVSNASSSSCYGSSGGGSADGRPVDPRLQHRQTWQDAGVSASTAARAPPLLRLVPPTPHTAAPAGQPSAAVGSASEPQPNHHDEVLCGSPTSDMVAAAQSAAAPPAFQTSAEPDVGGASSAAPSYTANRGGVAFTIAAEGAGGRSPLRPVPHTASPMRGSARAAARAAAPPALQLHAEAADNDAPAGSLDWDLLNRQLREAGFGGLAMVSAAATAAAIANAAAEAAGAPGGCVLMAPEPGSLHRCLGSVLEQYVRRNKLVTELLAATEQSGRVAAQQEAALRDMQRELNAAKAAADRARRELAELSSQQLPKTEARYSAQLAKLRSEAAKMKESLREAEVEAATKSDEIRSMRATISGLQAAAGHSADVEVVALRQRVVQLEALVRSRDKELDKLKNIKEASVGQAEDGQANALDRAYEAEAIARRLEAELVAARTRVGQLEQANAKRDRDVATMREDLAAIKTCEAAASRAAAERAAAAEEAARRSEAEAGALRAKAKELEAQLRAARQELDKRRADSEALRSAAYEEVYRLEDEVRVLGADLAAARSRAAQLEHVVRAKERDVARAKDEKEAAKAAERERARVAEDVSIKLEAELQAVKVRLAQAEGGLRTSEREAARLAELLRQTQGAEVEAWLKQAKSEEGTKKLEQDFMSLRLRVLQLEAALKGRDKEVERLGRCLEAVKAEAHELTSKLAKSEEAAKKTEGELSAARGKVLSLEGHVRVKEREQERLVRVVEGLKAGEAEVASRQGALEEAARRLEGALVAARGRVSGLEGVVRARDAAVERLNRQLEAAKTSDFERTAQVSKMEEAARQQEAESGALRQRVVQLEGLLRTKERELERGNRQAEAARATEADLERRLADGAAAASKLEAEVAAGRTRAAQLGEELRARERELATLARSLEAQRSAEHSANVVAGKTEEAAKRLDSEAGELRQRLAQAEGLLRVREREAERAAKALEAAQVAAADAAFRQGEADAASRRLEAEAVGLRQRLAQAEGAVRARERDVDRAEKLVEQAKCAEAEADTRRRAAEASVSAMDVELASLRSRISQLEVAARGHSKEVERLTRVMDQSKTAEIEATARAQRSEMAAKQVAAELASARGRLSKLEASLAGRDVESVRLQKVLATAEAAAAAQEARSEEFIRRVESDLAAMRQRAVQLAGLLKGRDRQLTTLRGGSEVAQAEQEKAAERLRQSEEVIRKLEAELVSERQQAAATAGQLRGRDKQITTLRNGLEALQADQENTTAQLRKCEEALRKLGSDLSAERQRAVQLDGQVKARDREVERLTRQLEAGRDQSSSAAVFMGKEAAGLKEAAAKAEAALATARARITELESELLSKERQLDGLQRLAGYSRAGDAEAAALAAERAGRAEEAAKRLDVELAGVRQKYSQLEHMYRSREAVIDKLKASLAEKVAREERRLARDKAAYSRIRAAYLQTMAPGGSSSTGGGGNTPSGKAAGAMAAAARELRPVEIVGLYESRREALEEELSVCRAEVRSLAEQLRDAQNLITMKERSGAWRTPQELADMQARVIMLERRCADLQREVERGRAEAAEAGRAAERRLAEAERRAAALKEDNEALVHELDARPTLQENRALKRELEILEKRVLQMKGSAAASGAGAVAEGGETALGLAVASKGRGGGPLMTTAQRMARDKAMHRLGLRALEDWPKDVLVDLMQDVCIELDLSDATTLPAAVRKTLRVVDAAPRMEAFIAAVCEAVYKRGAAFVPPHIDGTTDPNRVLEVLAVWLGLLQEGSQLRGVMRSVSEALSSRAEGMAIPIHGPGDVLLSIRQLVEAEAVALTARESLAAASQHMAQQPEALLSRLVHHFMRLFDCPSLDGVVPCVNRLYVSLNELRNFARSLAAALGLPADAGASACMARVRELLDVAAGRGDSGPSQQQRGSVADGAAGGDRLLPDYIKGNHTAATAHSPAASAGQPPAASGGVATVGVEVSAALERLMAVFAVRTAGAAADAAERAVGRLRRLDEVLPRYQRLTSQLFEALRCTSLEEVMPALRQLLAAAQQAQ